jgi:hypothetical protein
MKILIDMKAKPFIQVGRTSWDEYYDFPTEHNFLYKKIFLSKNQFNYFSKITNTEAPLGTYSSGLFGGSSIRATNGYSQSYINGLNIEAKKNWTSGDDAAEFWINDLGLEYYHKYKIIENGVTKETNWTPVNEDIYYKNINNLGMAIISKPKGYYDNEKVTKAILQEWHM